MNFLLDNILLVAIALASGGLLLWPKLSKGGGTSALGTLEATQLINHRNAIVVDVRDEAAFAAGSLAGARHLPFDRLDARAAEFARFKARPVLVVCASGQQSTRALAAFKAQGFDEAYVLAGGIDAWKAASLPLVTAQREAPKVASKDSNRKARNDARARAKGAAGTGVSPTPATTPEAAAVAAAVEPAGAVGQSAVPLADAVAVADDAAAAKVV